MQQQQQMKNWRRKKNWIQFAHKLTAEQNNLLNCFKLIEGCKNYKEHTLEKWNNCTSLMTPINNEKKK